MGGEVLQLIFDNGKVRIARTQGVQKMAQWHAHLARDSRAGRPCHISWVPACIRDFCRRIS